MSNDNSVVTICAEADRAECNQAMAAFFGDDPGSDEISVPLSSDGQLPVTHRGCASFVDASKATALKDWPNGTLPTPAAPWSNYDLDETSALEAGQAMVMSVMTGGNFNTLAKTNFEATIQSLGLQQIT